MPIVEIRPESGFAIVELVAMNIGRSRVRVADRYVHLLWSICYHSCLLLICSGICDWFIALESAGAGRGAKVSAEGLF